MSELIQRLRKLLDSAEETVDFDREPGDADERCTHIDIRPDDFESLMTEVITALSGDAKRPPGYDPVPEQPTRAMLGDMSTIRTAFEAWYGENDAEPTRSRAIERSGEGYRLMGAHQAWVAWQGAWERFASPDEIQALEAAASAVVKRWDTPSWKDVPHTAEFIHALRDAVNNVRTLKESAP